MLRNEEVVEGHLHPELDPEGPEIREALRRWEGAHYRRETPFGTHLTLVRRRAPPMRNRWWLHGLLLAATLFTTTLAGAFFAGEAPLRMALVPAEPLLLPVPVGLNFAALPAGLLFSLPLCFILLAHELGHFVAARRHRMDVSPPYFIPAPHWFSLIGTFGAFIRLRSAILNRAVLLDVGAAGPVLSFVLSVPALWVGLALSESVPVVPDDALTPYVAMFAGQVIWLGGSLGLEGASFLAGTSGSLVLLHPLALAGWLGLFVTALNLFPLSQLDGGHVLYALLGRRQRWFGILFLLALLGLGFLWVGWWVWAGLILLLSRGRIQHPPVYDMDFPVRGARRWVGWACLAIFMLSFTPVPFQI